MGAFYAGGAAVMARARNIKPGFFTNDVLAEIPMAGRLLFAGLWTIADREGRLEDRPKKIKAQLMPYDDVDIDCLLNELGERGFILRYSADNNQYIQVVNWNKHQNPHVKESLSTIPAPYKNSTGTIHAPEIPAAAGLIPDSLNLIPDSSKNTCASKPDALADFNEFWLAYPRKQAKDKAEKAWKKLKPNEQLHDRILHALALAKTSADWTKDAGKFIPYPASWLNGKRWEDDPGGTDAPWAGAL